MSFIARIKQFLWKKGVNEENVEKKSIIETEIGGEREFNFRAIKQKAETGYNENTTTVSPNSTDCYLKDKDDHQNNDRNIFVFGESSDHVQTEDIIEESEETMRKYGAIPKKRNKKLNPAKHTPKQVMGVPNTSYKPNDPEENPLKKRKMSDLLDSTDQSGGRLVDTNCQSPDVLYGSRTTGYESDCESIGSSSVDKMGPRREDTFDRTDLPRHFRSVPNLRDTGDKATHFHIGHVEHWQMPTHSGQGHSITTINTTSSTESRDIVTKVEGRTHAMCDIHKQVNIKVQTELYIGAEEYLKRPNKKNFVVLKGSSCGCQFTAQMLFANYCEENPDAKGYVLDNSSEWSVVDLKRKSVVLIQDICGTASFDKSRFDEFARILGQNMLPLSKKNGTVTVIVTMRDFPTEDIQPFTDKYQDYMIYATKKQYRPSDETKRELVKSFMDQFDIRVGTTERTSRNKKDNVCLINTETKEGIVPLLGNVGYIRILNDFFSWGLNDGLMFFRKPTRSLVTQIRYFAENNYMSFITLLAVYVHEGGLGRAGIDQLKELRAEFISRKFWFSIENGLNTLPKGKLKHPEIRKSKQEIRKQSNERQMLLSYAREHQVMPKLADNIYREARKLEGSFLEENREIYRFVSERVKNSFLVVCCEHYPEALKTCDGAFFFDFVKPYNQSSLEDKDEYFFIDRESEKGYQAFMMRLKEEMLSGNVAQCMRHPAMSIDFFRDFIKFFGERTHFLKFLSDKKHWKWLVLKATDNKEEMSSLVYGIEHEEKDETITDIILEEALWMEKRKKEKWHEITRAQEQKATVRAAEKARTKTFLRLIEMGVSIPDQAFMKAIESTSSDIIDVILQRQPVRKQKCKALLHALEVYTDMKGSKQKESDAALDIFKKISSEVSINYKEDGVESLIHFAAARKNSRMLKILLEGGRILGDSIDSDLVSTTGETALTIATRKELPENVRLLLKNGANQKLKDNTTTLPIFIACREGIPSIVKILREANPYIIKEKDINGMCPLMVAVLHGRLETVKYLLKGGYDYLEMKDNKGHGALHIAAERGNLLLVDKLIKAGFSPTDMDYLEETPLSLACLARRHTTVRCLLKTFAGENYTDKKIMMRAIKARDRELVQLLLEFGHKINFFDDVYGTPLFVAVQSREHDMLKFLLDKGADPNITQDGSQPIHIAGSECDIIAAKILRQYKADVRVKQKITGETILHIVVKKNCLEVVKKLFTFPECKEILDSKDAKGETAMHIASRHGYIDTVKCLLMAGASPTIYSKGGLLPKDLVKLQKKEISVKDKDLWNRYCDIEKILENPKSYADEDL